MNKAYLMSLVAALAAGSVMADDYVTLTTDDKPSGNGQSSLVYDPGHWSIAGVPDSSHDYYVGTGRLLCTPNVNNDTATYTFQGRSLTLDGGSGFVCLAHCSKGSSTMDYGTGQVYLKSGVYIFNAPGDTVKMNATVQASEDDPFVFLYNTSLTGASIKYLTLNLQGAAGTGLRFERPVTATSSFVWKLSGTAVDFRGLLDVRRMTVVADAAYPFGGTLRLSDGGIFKFGNKTGSNGIGALELLDGGALTVDGGTTQEVGTLRLDGGSINFQDFRADYEVPSGYGLITVLTEAVTNRPVTVNLGKTSHTVDALAACSRVEAPLIRFPKGASVSSDAFRLVLRATVKEKSGTSFPPAWFPLVKEDADGYPALYAVRQEVVEHVQDNALHYGLRETAAWKNGAPVPHAGVGYHAFGSSCKFAVDEQATEFKGDWLFAYYGQTWLKASEFTIPRWILRGNHKVYVDTAATTVKGGTWEIVYHAADVWTEVVGADSNAHALTIASDLCGDGCLTFNSRTSTVEADFNALTLTGNNAGFTGKLFFGQRMTVTASDAHAFGGARPALDYSAVTFGYGVKLVPSGSLAFDEPTCGLVFGNTAELTSTTENPLTIRCPRTLLGGQKKFGNGPLAVAGAPRFGDASSETPAGGDYYLSVRGGTIRPLTADAFDGCRMQFYNGTGIVLDWKATGDLRTQGLRDVKPLVNENERHLAVNTAGYAIPISFDVGGIAKLEGVEPEVHGLVTVPTAEAAATRSVIKVVKPFRGVKVTIVETADAEAGTTTFSARVEPTGLVIFVR